MIVFISNELTLACCNYCNVIIEHMHTHEYYFIIINLQKALLYGAANLHNLKFIIIIS